MEGKVQKVTDASQVFSDDFQFTTAPFKSKKLIVLFYRDGCGWCERYKPDFVAASLQDPDPNVVYLKVDVTQPDVQSKLSNAYIRIEGVPTIASYHDGRFFSYLEGPRTVDSTIQYTMGIGRAPRFVKQR